MPIFCVMMKSTLSLRTSSLATNILKECWRKQLLTIIPINSTHRNTIWRISSKWSTTTTSVVSGVSIWIAMRRTSWPFRTCLGSTLESYLNRIRRKLMNLIRWSWDLKISFLTSLPASMEIYKEGFRARSSRINSIWWSSLSVASQNPRFRKLWWMPNWLYRHFWAF